MHRVLNLRQLAPFINANTTLATERPDNKTSEEKKPERPPFGHQLPVRGESPNIASPGDFETSDITSSVKRLPTHSATESLVDALSDFLGPAGKMTTQPNSGRLAQIMLAAIGETSQLVASGDAGMNAARDAVEGGENVDEVAESYGITDASLRAELEDIAARTSGLAMIQQEASLKQICEVLGIHDSAIVDQLRMAIAMNAIQFGSNVRQIVSSLEISDPESIRQLEIESTVVHGLDRVRRGARVDEIAEELGIADPDCLARLDRVAAEA